MSDNFTDSEGIFVSPHVGGSSWRKHDYAEWAQAPVMAPQRLNGTWSLWPLFGKCEACGMEARVFGERGTIRVTHVCPERGPKTEIELSPPPWLDHPNSA